MTPALILAGGLGTRLRGVVGDLPKPLADVGGHPFLWWLLRRLGQGGVSKAYLSVGYRHELIQEQMGARCCGVDLEYIVETELLGTGGAIRKALSVVESEEVVVLNGDTLALVDMQEFIKRARASGRDIVMALAWVEDAGRYGTVDLDDAGGVCAFVEKGKVGPGLINAGVYWMKTSVLKAEGLPQKFSLEQDFLAARLSEVGVAGLSMVTDFIDIGIPQDYALAQSKVPALVGY